MRHSTTIWAAALTLASISGPFLATAEAMPAPQQTDAKPRYYFPRHVKRVFTNSTEPPSSTLLPSTTSDLSELRTRQNTDDLASFFESLLNTPSGSSTSSDSATTTFTDYNGPLSTGESAASSSVYTPAPAIPLHLSDSSSAAPTSVITSDNAGTTPTSDVASTGGFPTSIVLPSSTPDSAPASPTSIDSPTSPSDNGSTGGSQVTPTSVDSPTSPSDVGSTGGSQVTPTSVDSPTSPSDIGSTDSGPATPTSIDSPTSPSDVGSTDSGPATPTSIDSPTSPSDVGSTGDSQVTPTSVFSSDSPTSPSDTTVQSTGVQPLVIPLSSVLSDVLGPSSTPDVVGSTGVVPPLIVTATTSSDPATTSDGSASEPTGIIVGLTTALGISPSSTPAVTDNTGSPESTQGSLDPVASLLSTVVTGLQSVLAPSDSATGDVPSPTDTATGITPPPGASGTGTGDVSATTAPPDPLSSILSPVVSGVVSGISSVVVPVGSGLSSILVPVASGLSSVLVPVASGVSSVLVPVASDVSSIVVPVASGVPSVAVPVASGVSSVVVPVASGVSSIVSGVTGPVTSGAEPLTTVVPVLTSDLGSVVSSAVSGLPLPTSIPSSVGTGMGTLLPAPTSSVNLPLTTGVSSGTLPVVSDGTSYPGTAPTAPVATTDSISSLPIPTSVPSGVFPPTTSSDATASSVASSIGTSPPEYTPSSATITSTPVIPATESSYGVSPTSSSSELPAFSLAPQTILPTGSDSATTFLVPTSIAMEPTTAAQPTAKMSGMPSNLPQIIRPPDGIIQPQPANSTLCEFGFQWELNFNFVLTSQDASNQLFYYIPQAVADAVGIPIEQVVMSTLKPYDTTRSLGFITTLALFYIPTDQFDKLLPQMSNPPDKLWNNNNNTINALTSLINTAIPLLAGPLPVDGSATQAGSASSATASGQGDDGPMGKGESQPVRATSAYIATGAIVGAFAYGAAMFFVARRYRNKRMSHTRASSVPSANHGNSPGAVWMSGGRGGRSTPGGRDSRGSGSSNGRSVRTAQISAPVMAENSLGWN